MKPILLLLVLAATVFLTGCGSSAPMADTSTAKKKMPPGWKPTGDVLLPINK
jgi:hypothetical protein